MRVGSVLTKKLTRILTSIANELICHHDTRDLAKMSFYSRVSGISRQVTTVKSTPSLVCTALISMETRSVVPHFDPDVSPLAAIRPQPVGSRSTTCIAAKLLRLCTVHMIDL